MFVRIDLLWHGQTGHCYFLCSLLLLSFHLPPFFFLWLLRAYECQGDARETEWEEEDEQQRVATVLEDKIAIQKHNQDAGNEEEEEVSEKPGQPKGRILKKKE